MSLISPNPIEFDLGHWNSLREGEDPQGRSKFGFLAGCDEVGRGPLAGPVASATVLIFGPLDLDHQKILKSFLEELSGLGITDSKKLSSKKRKQILNHLGISFSSSDISPPLFSLMNRDSFKAKISVVYSLCIRDHEEIDRLNILQASLRCMADSFQVAIEGLYAHNLFKPNQFNKGKLLVDGNKVPPLSNKTFDVLPVVKGDSHSLAIGLASIIAKEFRDCFMFKMDELYPQYGFSKNAGYPTKLHREAIKNFGPSPIHRKTFGGVKEFV